MRRSRTDIIIDILEATKEGVNKTRVVFSTNLNFNLARKYIELLQKHGLVENISDKYITTDRGKIFLAKAKDVVQQLEAR